MKDYYEVLGISPQSSEKDVKERFRFLSHAFHPDKFATPSQRKQAEELFKSKSEAYRVLSAQESRTLYDKKRKKVLRFSDVKNNQFDNTKNGRTSHTRKSKSLTNIYLIGFSILAIVIIAGAIINLSSRKQGVKEGHGDAYSYVEVHKKTKQHMLLNNSETQVASMSGNKISIVKSPESTEESQKHTTETVDGQTKTLTINEINDTINYSGKIRMLSMKMAKLYGVQVLSDYPVDKKQKAKKDLHDTQKVVNKIYMALLAFPPASANTEVNKAIKESRAYWHQMEKIFSKEPTKEVFSEILDMSDNLLEKNNTMSKYLESLAPYAQSELIDIAGRQQMYSQKLARDYLAANLGVDKEYRIDLMLDAVVEFESAMFMMEGATENTAKIKGLIKSITKMEWRKVYKTATECIESNGVNFNVVMMIKFCDTLLDKTNRLTKLYVGISNRNIKT